MYAYSYDERTGGLLLTSSPLLPVSSREPRPVYYKELDILGFDRYWKYEKNDAYPYMWAESNSYYYRGRKVAETKGGSCCTAPQIIIIDAPEPDGKPLRFVDIPGMVQKNRAILEGLAQDTIKKVYNTYHKYSMSHSLVEKTALSRLILSSVRFRIMPSKCFLATLAWSFLILMIPSVRSNPTALKTA